MAAAGAACAAAGRTCGGLGSWITEEMRLTYGQTRPEELGQVEPIGGQALVKAWVQALHVHWLAVGVAVVDERPLREDAAADHPRQHERPVERHRKGQPARGVGAYGLGAMRRARGVGAFPNRSHSPTQAWRWVAHAI